ncbi:ESX secretion-associated protein EspG [Nocardia sp. NPDC051052]|uniref:ESX secretion-associated protein EspG n=1 Tax=Nocardia sp. NPDC051052 TaxID=3364322 RepID=UPI0037A8D927
MTRTWRLTGLEYLVLRERLVGRQQNWPMDYYSDIRGYYDFQFRKARVWGEWQARWEPELAEALVQSLDAEVRLAAHVYNRGAPTDLTGRMVLAGKRFGDRAVLIHGRHTHTVNSHDDIEITVCDAVSLTRLIVDKLPPMAAGSLPRVELLGHNQEETVDHWHGRSSVYDDDHAVDSHCRQWQAAPKGTVGRIVLTQGHSKFGPSGKVTKQIFWEEHVGDGGYVIDLDPTPAAVATDTEGLRALIDRQCGELLLVGQDESRRGVERESVYDDAW